MYVCEDVGQFPGMHRVTVQVEWRKMLGQKTLMKVHVQMGRDGIHVQ